VVDKRCSDALEPDRLRALSCVFIENRRMRVKIPLTAGIEERNYLPDGKTPGAFCRTKKKIFNLA
jgi:hypothetical protein